MFSVSFSLSLGARKGNLMLFSGSSCLGKDSATHPQGDDAHFVGDRKQTVGLADGVGSWIKEGIDAGLYARELMNNSRLATLRQPDGKVNPQKVLDEAFSKTKAKGSSTACIITLQEDDKLHAVNIGDSGFRVIRQGAVLFKSKSQQSRFNAPYQLGNASSSDKPWKAMEITVAVEPGDVVIAGSDGLFDNLHDSQILEALKTGIEQGLHPDELAHSVARQAYLTSKDKKAVTPFMQEANKAGIDCRGGKEDDITVIVSRILSRKDCI